jgi:hypothetical protein
MNLVKNFATSFYEWLKEISEVEVFREPMYFNEDEPAPDEYISYSASVGNFGSNFIQPLTIYSKSTAWAKVMDIAERIETKVSEKGIILRYDWGIITIEKGDPFYQDKPDEDGSTRAGYINLLINIYQKKV